MPVPGRIDLSNLSDEGLAQYIDGKEREKEQEARFAKQFMRVRTGAAHGFFGDGEGAINALTFMLEPLRDNDRKESLNRLDSGVRHLTTGLLAARKAKERVPALGLGAAKVGASSAGQSVLKAAQSVTQKLVSTLILPLAHDVKLTAKALTSDPTTVFQETAPVGNERDERIAALATGVAGDRSDDLARSMRTFKSRFNKIVGLPEEQHALNTFRQNLPGAAKLLDAVGTFGALVVSTRGLGAASAVTTGTGLFSRVAPSLGLGGKGAGNAIRNAMVSRGISPGLLGATVGGAGGVLQYSSEVLKDQVEPNGLDLTLRALSGAGLGFFLMTALSGRPFGVQATTYNKAVLAHEGLPWLSRVKNLGLAHRFYPRLTVGHMLESGALGAGFVALEESGRGTPPMEALQKGMATAPEWIGIDLAFAGLGSSMRWGASITQMNKVMGETLKNIGRSKFAPGRLTHEAGVMQASATQARVTRAIGSTAVGAGIGAGLAGATGEDVRVGAILGAAGGAAFGYGFIDRTAPLMSKKLRTMVLDGTFATKATPALVRELAELGVADAGSQVAAGMDDASRLLFLRALGKISHTRIRNVDHNKALAILKARAVKAHARLFELNPELELAAEPRILAEQIRAGAELLKIREAENHLMKLTGDGTSTIANPQWYKSGTPTTAQLLARAEETRRIETFTFWARQRLQNNQIIDAEVALIRNAEQEASLARVTKELRTSRAAGREANSIEHIREEINLIRNRRIAIATDATSDMEMSAVFAEISRATGETTEEVIRRLNAPFTTPGLARIMENPGARQELNLLRAGTDAPGKAITKPVLRRQGLTSELKRDLKGFELMFDEIDTLLAHADVGEVITVHDIRRMMKKFGRGGVKGETGGLITVDFPFIGQMTDFAPALLKRAKLFLKDFKPNLALSTLGASASMADADAITAEPGFIEYTDNNTGEPKMTWMASAKAAAGLAAIGMVLKPGFPLRIRGMAKAARALLHRQEAKTFKKLGTNREAMIYLAADGGAGIISGEAGSVSISSIRGRGIVLSLHNHPTSVKQIMGQTQFFDKKASVLGDAILNSYPSPADYTVMTQAGIGGNPLIFGIVTPIEGKITLAGYMNKISGGRQSATSGNIRQGNVIGNLVRSAITQVVRESRGNLIAHKVIKSSESLTSFELLGLEAQSFGRAQLEKKIDQRMRQVGIHIQRNVSDDAFERIVIEALSLTRTRPDVLKTIQTQETMRIQRHGYYGQFARQAANPVKKAQLIKALTGAPPPRAGRLASKAPVAPSAAREVREILPESVTPQEISRPVRTLEGVQEWADRHGMRVAVTENQAGQRVFQAITGKGEKVAEAISIREMMNSLMITSRQQAQMRKAARRGVTGIVPGAVGAMRIQENTLFGFSGMGLIAGGIIGSLGANRFQTWLGHPNDDDDLTEPLVYGVIGAIVGAVGTFKLGEFALRGQSREIFNLFKPTVADELPARLLSRMRGKPSRIKTGVDKHGKNTYKKGDGPTERQFLINFPIEDQVEHFRLRMRATAATKGEAEGELRNRFHNTLRKFIPSWIPDEHYIALQSEVISTGRALGFSESEATTLWHGALVRSTTGVERRAPAGSGFKGLDLFALAESRSPALFGPNADLDTVRTIYRTAEVLAGPALPHPTGAIESARKNWRPALSPNAVDLVEIQNTASGRRISLSGGGGGIVDPGNQGPGGVIPQQLIAPQSFKSTADRFSQYEDTALLGDMMGSLYDSVTNATNKIQSVNKDWSKRLNGIFHQFSDDEMTLATRLMENPVEREAARLVNPKVHTAAVEFRQLLDDLADKLGIPHQERWQDYLPWIYNSKTMSEMKIARFADRDLMYVSLNSGVPEHKIMNHMRPRSHDRPLGPIETNPLVIGNIYINGAVRKLHIDQVLATHNAEWFKKFASMEPFLASDMATWTLDSFGIPNANNLRSLARMQRAGMRLEDLAVAASRHSFHTGSFIQSIADRYFFGQSVGRRFSNFARGFEFHSKLGANFVSPMVNLSQLYVNTGTDIGLVNTLLGGTKFMGQVAVGRIAEASAARAVRKGMTKGKFNSFLAQVDAKFAGTEKLRLTREYGILGDNSQRLLDEMNETIRLHQEIGVGTKISAPLAGATLGLVGAHLADQTGPERAGKGAIGAAAGIALTSSGFIGKRNVKRGVRAYRKGLIEVRKALIMPFSTAETINRLMTAGGGIRAAETAARVTTKAGRQREVVKGVVGNVALGGGTVAAIDAANPDEGERGASAAVGGLIGAAATLPIALAGRRATIGSRVRKGLTASREALEFNPSLRQSSFDFVNKLKEMGPVTEKEVEAWWVRQLLDMTQFRFGREGRAAFFRNSTFGEIAGSLQSFTINQMEFVGSRYRSMWESMLQHVPGNKLGAKTTALRSTVKAGDLDLRFFRHAALLGGAAAAMTSLAGAMGSDKSYASWLSRIGFGMIPFVRWNEDATTWQVVNIAQQLTGPFIGDVFQGANTVWHLMTNPDAMRAWDEQLDDLSVKLFTGFRQLPDLTTRVGEGMQALGFEASGERFQRQTFGMPNQIRQLAEQPVSSIVGNARPTTASGGGGSSGIFGGGSSGTKPPFSGGFGGGF